MKIQTTTIKLFICLAVMVLCFNTGCKKDDKNDPIIIADPNWHTTALIKDNSGFAIMYEGDSAVSPSLPGFTSRIIPLDMFTIGPLFFFSYVHEAHLQQGTNHFFFGKTFFPDGTLRNTSGSPYTGELDKPLGSSYDFVKPRITSTAFGPFAELINIKDQTSRYATYNPGSPRLTFSGDVVHDPIVSMPIQKAGGAWVGSNEFVLNKQLRRWEDPNINQITRGDNMEGAVVEYIWHTSKYIAVFMGRDSVFAFVRDTTEDPTGAPDWVAPLSGSTGTAGKAFIKVSKSGNDMGICFHTDMNYFTTINYHVPSNTFSKVLDNSLLTYSGDGTDYDIDEFGNVYYTGYAANGSNRNGVSVYKLDPSGNSLIGLDNFMLTGGVELLKYYQGNVYLALSYYHDTNGNQKGPQITIVKQQ